MDTGCGRNPVHRDRGAPLVVLIFPLIQHEGEARRITAQYPQRERIGCGGRSPGQDNHCIGDIGTEVHPHRRAHLRRGQGQLARRPDHRRLGGDKC